MFCQPAFRLRVLSCIADAARVQLNYVLQIAKVSNMEKFADDHFKSARRVKYRIMDSTLTVEDIGGGEGPWRAPKRTF